jgi:hypothetical protein
MIFSYLASVSQKIYFIGNKLFVCFAAIEHASKNKDRESKAPEAGKIFQDDQLGHHYLVIIVGTKRCL